MAIFGLGDDDSKVAVKEKKQSSAKKDASAATTKKSKKAKQDDEAPADSQEAEAKALLEKMEAKKDADECAFC